jgi:catechol 2,3-dioxygenase-like lactoylglutathione lyase family enzyme
MVPELLVGHFETSRAFYVELLGFTVCFKREDPSFAYLDLGGAQLMIEQDHPDAWLTADLEAPRGRGINLQIEVEDAARLRDRLKAARHEPFRDLTDAWYDVGGGVWSGQRQFLVQDPDGYLLRFAEPLGERSP